MCHRLASISVLVLALVITGCLNQKESERVGIAEGVRLGGKVIQVHEDHVFICIEEQLVYVNVDTLHSNTDTRIPLNKNFVRCTPEAAGKIGN